MSPEDLSEIVVHAPARERILERLKQNGISQWSDLKGRQIPMDIILDQRHCAIGTARTFARFVRRHGGFLVVDAPEGWKSDRPEWRAAAKRE